MRATLHDAALRAAAGRSRKLNPGSLIRPFVGPRLHSFVGVVESRDLFARGQARRGLLMVERARRAQQIMGNRSIYAF
jgi:hypothetical protein